MTSVGGWVRRLLRTPFGLAALGCLVFTGWALWSGGILDGAVAKKVRTSSVYAAPGVGLDTNAAEKVIGNRRLVVIMLKPGADLRAGCDSVKRAAAGTLVLLLSRNGDEFRTYGCALFAGGDNHFGNALVAEETIGNGLDTFVDRPLDAVKVVAVNYDQLAKAHIIPGDARTISPSLPRYVIAVAAMGAVLVGTTLLYAAARRAGRLAAARQARRDRATDSRTVLSAAMAVVAQQIIDLDPRYTVAVTPDTAGAAGDARRSGAAYRSRKRRRRGGESPRGSGPGYRKLTSDYMLLLDDIAAADRRGEVDFTGLTARAEALADGFRTLTA